MKVVQLTLEQRGLNCMGPLIHGWVFFFFFFSVNTRVQYYAVQGWQNSRMRNCRSSGVIVELSVGF